MTMTHSPAGAGPTHRFIRIDTERRTAEVDAFATASDIRAAAAREGLHYPHRPHLPGQSIAAQITRDLRVASLLRQGTILRSLNCVDVAWSDGSFRRIERDAVARTVARELAAELRTGASIIGAAVELAEAPGGAVAILAMYAHRSAAALAANTAVALVRPVAADLVDGAALSRVADFGGLDVADTGAVVVLELNARDGAALNADAELAISLLQRHGASEVHRHDCPELVTAVETVVLSARPVLDASAYALDRELGVPVSDLPDLVRCIDALEALRQTPMALIANAGDGTVSVYVLPAVPHEKAHAVLAELRGLAGEGGSASSRR